MSTVPALVWLGPREMGVRAIPRPEPGPDEAIVFVEAAGICGSEVEGYLGRQANRTAPLIMGHEFAGTVARVGRAVDTAWVGDRVTVNPLLSCGTCAPCNAGMPNACERRQLVGVHRPGGFAAEVAVPARALVRVPRALDPRLAALTEPVANGVHAMRLGTARAPVSEVLVIGAGTIGLAALQVAVASGVASVTVAEPHEPRRAIAAALGARATIASAAAVPPGSMPLVVDAVGRTETRIQGIAATRAGGTMIAIGLHDDRTEVSFHDLIRREVAVQPSYAYTDVDFARALELLVGGKVQVGSLAAMRPLVEGPDAFAQLAAGAADVVKIFLAPSA